MRNPSKIQFISHSLHPLHRLILTSLNNRVEVCQIGPEIVTLYTVIDFFIDFLKSDLKGPVLVPYAGKETKFGSSTTIYSEDK
ncbi:hypothetical protein L1887_13815 [Cichorium endivia]|nr:hypothetical protein L1887_13815 [Cichorium endivia]